ncbi:TRAP transporter small permease [Vitreimonas flagellata]|uniref:TRAP transporter small permease n=1 Tax=Vitreimonas flagellata TaxID=2560861 RepID=UPI0010757145|nr:TRAP transporter small permease subunit [Vitreimonas flagellata]
MKTLARIASTISAWLAKIALALSCVGLLILVFCMLVQVVSRYMLAAPLAWTEELARFAMVWAGLLGATVAFHRRADPVLLRRTSLPRWLRKPAQWLELIALTMLSTSIVAASPGFLTLAAARTTETLQAPAALVVSIVPISFSLMLVHALARALRLLSGEEEADDQGLEAQP